MRVRRKSEKRQEHESERSRERKIKEIDIE